MAEGVAELVLAYPEHAELIRHGIGVRRVLGWPDIWIGRGTHRVARETGAALHPHKLAPEKTPRPSVKNAPSCFRMAGTS